MWTEGRTPATSLGHGRDRPGFFSLASGHLYTLHIDPNALRVDNWGQRCRTPPGLPGAFVSSAFAVGLGLCCFCCRCSFTFRGERTLLGTNNPRGIPGVGKTGGLALGDVANCAHWGPQLGTWPDPPQCGPNSRGPNFGGPWRWPSFNLCTPSRVLWVGVGLGLLAVRPTAQKYYRWPWGPPGPNWANPWLQIPGTKNPGGPNRGEQPEGPRRDPTFNFVAPRHLAGLNIRWGPKICWV